MFAILYLGSEDYRVFAAYGPYRNYTTAQRDRDLIAQAVHATDDAPDDAVTIIPLETYVSASQH